MDIMMEWHVTGLESSVQIPLKRKYRPEAKLYGYPRRHNGNGTRRKPKSQSRPSVYSHVRDDHVMVVDVTGKRRMLHGVHARQVLGR